MQFEKFYVIHEETILLYLNFFFFSLLVNDRQIIITFLAIHSKKLWLLEYFWWFVEMLYIVCAPVHSFVRFKLLSVYLFLMYFKIRVKLLCCFSVYFLCKGWYSVLLCCFIIQKSIPMTIDLAIKLILTNIKQFIKQFVLKNIFLNFETD